MSISVNVNTAVGLFMGARAFRNADGSEKFNKDGSQTLIVTLGIRHNWTQKDDQSIGIDYIDFEVFIPADARNPFASVQRRELIGFQYRPRKSVWQNAEGETRSRQYLEVNRFTVDYLMTKAERERLIAENARRDAVKEKADQTDQPSVDNVEGPKLSGDSTWGDQGAFDLDNVPF